MGDLDTSAFFDQFSSVNVDTSGSFDQPADPGVIDQAPEFDLSQFQDPPVSFDPDQSQLQDFAVDPVAGSDTGSVTTAPQVSQKKPQVPSSRSQKVWYKSNWFIGTAVVIVIVVVIVIILVVLLGGSKCKGDSPVCPGAEQNMVICNSDTGLYSCQCTDNPPTCSELAPNSTLTCNEDGTWSCTCAGTTISDDFVCPSPGSISCELDGWHCICGSEQADINLANCPTNTIASCSKDTSEWNCLCAGNTLDSVTCTIDGETEVCPVGANTYECSCGASMHSDPGVTCVSGSTMKCSGSYYCECDPDQESSALTQCQQEGSNNVICNSTTGNWECGPDTCASDTDCSGISDSPSSIYLTDPISQAVYYGFCRYADNVSSCMSAASTRYANDQQPFSQSELPNAQCISISPTDDTNICGPPCGPFASRVVDKTGDISYASCVSPYNTSSASPYAYNPSGVEQTTFGDWTSDSNPYTDGFMWTIQGNITRCVVPIRRKSGGDSQLMQRSILSGHPFLVWKTRYGTSDSFYLYKNSHTDTGYPYFRLYHPASRSAIKNIEVHAPGGAASCAKDKISVIRLASGSNFDCTVQAHKTDDEKCYLFSMWNQCGSLSGDNDDVEVSEVGAPYPSCYEVLNMPVKNGVHRQMLVKSPSSTLGYDNPDTCEDVDTSDTGHFAPVAVSGITAGDSSFTFDFYQDANMSWPPTATSDPWVQPIQFCLGVSTGKSENYIDCNLYGYTFSNTDSADPTTYKSVGWLTQTLSPSGSLVYTTTNPTADSFGTTLSTTNVASNNFTLSYSKSGKYLGIGAEYTSADDSFYTNTDGNSNVLKVVLTSDEPAINMTNTGALYTTQGGMTYYLCSYTQNSTHQLLWINLDGEYTFSNSITIRCVMWAIYYVS